MFHPSGGLFPESFLYLSWPLAWFLVIASDESTLFEMKTDITFTFLLSPSDNTILSWEAQRLIVCSLSGFFRGMHDIQSMSLKSFKDWSVSSIRLFGFCNLPTLPNIESCTSCNVDQLAPGKFARSCFRGSNKFDPTFIDAKEIGRWWGMALDLTNRMFH